MPHDAPAALQQIRAKIAAAAREAGRNPDDVTLIAVSKTFEAVDIQPVIAAGQRVFGENRVQEAQQKWPALKAATAGIELHLIGPLQSNKARDAVALFDVIHTVDRPKIAAALAAEMKHQNRRLRCSSRSIPARRRRKPASRQPRRSRSCGIAAMLWHCRSLA